MSYVPKHFFIVQGKASSEVSDLNAFDLALFNAGICEQNLVTVSSIIPDGAEPTEDRSLPRGEVTFCVMSQCRGTGGETVSQGIAYAYRKDKRGGYVAEGHLHGDQDSLKKELAAKIKEMGRIRGIEMEEPEFKIESLEIPKGSYGCALSALVFKD